MTVLLRQRMRNHLRRSRPEKILNVFQRIRLRLVQALRRSANHTSCLVTKAMSDRLLDRCIDTYFVCIAPLCVPIHSPPLRP
jgi:hypothetical protein